MESNPFSDAVHFLQQPAWTTAAYWLLLLGSIAVAAYCFAAIPEQRSARHLGNWLCRLLIGSMWWQQTLWKLPPDYTDQPDQPFGTTGLAYWMMQMAKGAAFRIQSDLVENVILPHFHLFAPGVYALEALTAAALILGLFVRFWGVVGALQILNLWLGLYNAEGEWPWTYFFLLVLQVVFALHRFGRSLGVDAIIVERYARVRGRSPLGQLVVEAVT